MEYLVHLSRDKKLAKVCAAHEPIELRARKELFVYLCASIMSQQLSTKVADLIYARFIALFEGRPPEPQEVLDLEFDKLRGIGLSNAKVRYVKNVASFVIEHGMEERKLNRMDNDEISHYLTQIKGVGRWTVEMLLMFALGREDVFAIDDLGIQNAMAGIYKLDKTDKKKFRENMLRISKKWSPYRTYACAHLWRWKDNTPARASGPKNKIQ